MNTEIVVFSATEAALNDLATRYKNAVFDVTTPDGMGKAKSAYKDINAHSITLESARVKEKADSLAHGRRVDSEAKRIAEQLDALRLPIKAQIETETKREERERAEKVRLEVERIAAEEKARKDAEEAKMAADRAEITRQQAEIARAQREAAAEAEAARRKIDEEQRSARVKIEEAERQSRLAREAADRVALVARLKAEAEAKAVRDTEEAKLKAERDEIDRKARLLAEAERRERDAAEAKAKAIRDAEEAKQREIQRQRYEVADANSMLITFQERFRQLPQFAGVSKAISLYLVAQGLEDAPGRKVKAA